MVQPCCAFNPARQCCHTFTTIMWRCRQALTKLSFSLLVIFLNFKHFLQHNCDASNNCPFPLSIFTVTHLYSSHRLAQYAVPSFSPTQRVYTSTLHWFHFFSTVVGYRQWRGACWNEEGVCVCVRGACAGTGNVFWGEFGMGDEVEYICASPYVGIRIAGQRGKGIGSPVTSIRVVLSAREPAGSIGNCVKGWNEAGSGRSCWSLLISKFQCFKWILCYSSWKIGQSLHTLITNVEGKFRKRKHNWNWERLRLKMILLSGCGACLWPFWTNFVF